MLFLSVLICQLWYQEADTKTKLYLQKMYWGASEKEEAQGSRSRWTDPQPRCWFHSCGWREGRRKAWQEETGTVCCEALRKPWPVPAGHWGAPGEDYLLKESLGRNRLALHSLQAPSLPENNWGRDHGLGWRLQGIRKSYPQLLSLQQCLLNPHEHCFKCSKHSALQ